MTRTGRGGIDPKRHREGVPHIRRIKRDAVVTALPIEIDRIANLAVRYEIAGIHRYSAEEVEPPPATLTKASRAFTKGILSWRDRRVDLLDDELLAHYLRKNLVS